MRTSDGYERLVEFSCPTCASTLEVTVDAFGPSVHAPVRFGVVVSLLLSEMQERSSVRRDDAEEEEMIISAMEARGMRTLALLDAWESPSASKRDENLAASELEARGYRLIGGVWRSGSTPLRELCVGDDVLFEDEELLRFIRGDHPLSIVFGLTGMFTFSGPNADEGNRKLHAAVIRLEVAGRVRRRHQTGDAVYWEAV